LGASFPGDLKVAEASFWSGPKSRGVQASGENLKVGAQAF